MIASQPHICSYAVCRCWSHPIHQILLWCDTVMDSAVVWLCDTHAESAAWGGACDCDNHATAMHAHMAQAIAWLLLALIGATNDGKLCCHCKHHLQKQLLPPPPPYVSDRIIQRQVTLLLACYSHHSDPPTVRHRIGPPLQWQGVGVRAGFFMLHIAVTAACFCRAPAPQHVCAATCRSTSACM